MKEINYKNFKRIYFCGVCGVSMSGLAKHLSINGHIVGGSDKNTCDVYEDLQKFNVQVFQGNSRKNISAFNPDLVVYTSAISTNGPELTFAKEQNIPTIKRSQLLGLVVKEYSKSIAVAGCHGKTTTTSMIANILICAGVNPTVFLGGYQKVYGNYLNGSGKICLCEACEYQKNF